VGVMPLISTALKSLEAYKTGVLISP